MDQNSRPVVDNFRRAFLFARAPLSTFVSHRTPCTAVVIVGVTPVTASERCGVLAFRFYSYVRLYCCVRSLKWMLTNLASLAGRAILVLRTEPLSMKD